MYFDRFDICEAYFMYALLWGEPNPKGKTIGFRLNKINFKARPSLKRASDLEDNALEIFNKLVDKYQYKVTG